MYYEKRMPIRFFRLKDCPAYLGMDRHRFKNEVRPFLVPIPIEKRGIAFDVLDLDAWADHYKACSGRPKPNRRIIWDVKKRLTSTNVGKPGISISKSSGRRICESTGANTLEEAERYLAWRIEQLRQASIYGVRPKRIFREAAIKFLLENQHKASIGDDAGHLKVLDKYIGDLPLESIHIGTWQTFIDGRKKDGVKMRTINHGLQVVRHILNLSAGVWLDEYGLTWLQVAPKIKLLPEPDARKPFPLNWEEQTRLFEELPIHLQRMALFAVNTGFRDREICYLKWEWEIRVPEIPNCSVFLIPGKVVKNRADRLVVLNDVAKVVVEEVRGEGTEYVFTYKGKPVDRMLRSAWRKARVRTGFPYIRVHDLKHTVGRRLRAAGVSFEDRQDLWGHKSGRITTHYSAVELTQLIEAANKVCGQAGSSPALMLIKPAYTASLMSQELVALPQLRGHFNQE